MGRKCCVTGCRSNYDSNDKITVFRLPRDKEERQRWKKAIPRDNIPDHPNTVVCIKHFPEGFETVSVKGSLRSKHLPSTFCNLPKSLIPTPAPLARTTKCRAGSFGPDCRHSCGNCSPAKPECDFATGACLAGCKPGYQEPLCKEQEDDYLKVSWLPMVLIIGILFLFVISHYIWWFFRIREPATKKVRTAVDRSIKPEYLTLTRDNGTTDCRQGWCFNGHSRAKLDNKSTKNKLSEGEPESSGTRMIGILKESSRGSST
ncbi:hypothetical protein PoB_003675700 [Plakobranchus ocellatus]|uniref:THAP-type domain-containing protein n=1 Tax=Plakobranchus ocellatus TaxID=259542 RepID=A0AAV4ASF3_9GAST|nr:hypothetical protein PoB_003675700 [Plakobranchus ocellatus]